MKKEIKLQSEIAFKKIAFLSELLNIITEKKSFSLFKNNVYNQSTLSKKKVLFSNLR